MSDHTGDDPIPDVSPEGSHSVEPTSHSSSTWKVLGTIDASDGIGVLGHATAGSGATTGVTGITDSTDTNAAGVRGEATTTGVAAETAGVEGIARANGDAGNVMYPKGVRGAATGSGVTYGVFGNVTSSDGQGVVGDATENGLLVPAGRPSGVIGATDRSSLDIGVDYGHGVVGVTLASSGTSYGVAGESTTPDGAGVRGWDRDGNGLGVLSDGDSKTAGNHQVTGDLDVGGSRSVSTINVTAELDTDQSFGGTFETVEFDIADDDWGTFDTSTGEFTAPAAGTYRVTVHLTWDTLFSNGIHSEAEIRKGGFLEARNLEYVAGDGSNGRLDHSFSKTMSVGSGQVINARLKQDSGSSAPLRGRPAETYMCITKVG